MSQADSNTFSIGIQSSSGNLPTWLSGHAVNEWVGPGQVPTFAMAAMDFSKLITAGLCDGAGNSPDGVHYYGHPITSGGILYFGGTLRDADSDFLVHGGGGAQAWAGNDVRGLRLSDNVPQWQVRNTPSPASQVWLNSYHNLLAGPTGQTPDPTNAYMRDALTPNSGHQYWAPQFVNTTNKFFRIGCRTTWEQDSTPGQGGNVDALNWASMQWDAPGTNPAIPIGPSTDSVFIKKHPITEKIYVGRQGRLYIFDPTTAPPTWTGPVYTSTAPDYDAKGVSIDTNRGKMLMFGKHQGVQDLVFTQDLTTYAFTSATFTYAPGCPTLHEQNLYWAAGFVFDPVADAHFFFQDDGNLYKIQYVSDSSYNVSQVVTTGTAPTAGGMTYVGFVGIWGKMQYVPALGGIVVLAGMGALQGTLGAQPNGAFFIRTH